jgi:hypothetical protein
MNDKYIKGINYNNGKKKITSICKLGQQLSRPESRIHDLHIGKIPLQDSIPMRTQTYIQTYPLNNSIRVQHIINNKINFII